MFVIYNTKTYALYYGDDYGHKRYETERAAKSALTKSGLDKAEWAVIDSKEFDDIEPIVSVRALMTGSPVLLRKRDVGNPAVDPSMEGYYTM
jgi:hypothetical protein